MKKQEERWLDKLISRSINSGEPQFDAEKWKKKYPEEFQMLLSRTEKRASSHQPNIWRIILKSPITKLAAAAVIIVAIGLFIAHLGPGDQPGAPKVSQVAKSPAEMMTAISLTMAYRRGGIEAVEEQCEKAFEMLGPRPGRITVQEILAELNGT